MPKYTITLKPVEHYFFGDERFFELGNSSSYLLKSMAFPQASTIIGMLRYYLLMKEGKLFEKGKDISKEEIDKLIGSNSFSFDFPPESYGKIKSISPVYIFNKNIVYYPIPKDSTHVLKLINDKNRLFNYGQNDSQEIFYLENYNNKIDYSQYYLDPISNIKYNSDQIFKEDSRTGNEKDRDGKSKEKAYYFQYFYRLLDDFSFVFEAEIDEDLTLNTHEIITMGGERSPFIINITDKLIIDTHKLIEYVKYEDHFPRLYLLSDTLCDASILSKTIYAWNTIEPHRNIQTRNNIYGANIDIKVNGKYKHTDGLQMSDRYFLLGKGSILYFKDINMLDEASKYINSDNLIKFGYNNSIILNK